MISCILQHPSQKSCWKTRHTSVGLSSGPPRASQWISLPTQRSTPTYTDRWPSSTRHQGARCTSGSNANSPSSCGRIPKWYHSFLLATKPTETEQTTSSSEMSRSQGATAPQRRMSPALPMPQIIRDTWAELIKPTNCAPTTPVVVSQWHGG